MVGVGMFLRRLAALLLLILLAGCASQPTEKWMTQSNHALGIPVKEGQILIRKGYSAGYSSIEKQSLWVSYILYAENLQKTPFPREKFFITDWEVDGTPATSKDYIRSGFDRGHLAPAADMAYSKETMKESFLMSNISPQVPECNRIYWLNTEKQIRQWALKEKCLCVVTGPVFSPEGKRKLGKSDITVPVKFFKAVMDLTYPYKMIACLVDNDRKENVRFLSVDELEKITGYDFFDKLDDALENELESQCDLAQWSKPQSCLLE
ncbi:MAG: DNA/RNA non-specific endonuclease [Lentisphaeria bacterium]|nr:DNA/RNA non-specific endonuclease [Lentisphaeria bacterium]